MRFLLIILLVAQSAFGAFGYYSPVSINSGQVPSTQTDFPVLVSVTDARFKTVANSGHVQNSSGFDIRPYTDSTLTTAITGYELERYNATTGEVVMWVKVASLSSSTTPFVLAYGDSGISTDGSSATTWSNNFISVYHLPDGTSLSTNDSLGAHNSTFNSGTAATGFIDGGIAYDGTRSTTMGAYSGPAAISLTAWVFPTNIASGTNTVINRGPPGGSINNATIEVKSTGKLHLEVRATGAVQYDGTGSRTLVNSTWYHVALTYDSTAGLVGYVNAASDNTAAANGTLATTSVTTVIGKNGAFNCCFFIGTIDEVRIASVVRSADWITTEYNNQSAPGTFATLGSESGSTRVMNNFFFSSW